MDAHVGGPVFWNAASFGANQNAFVTLSTVDPHSPSQGLLLKVQTGSCPEAGAIAVVYDAVAHAFRVSTFRPPNLTWTPYASAAATLVNGDKLGACVSASGVVTIYKNNVVAATVTLSAADKAFFNSRGGKIGLWTLLADEAFFDDFGGGTESTAPLPQKRQKTNTVTGGLTPKKPKKNMEIKRSGSQPSGKGPAEYFTGAVRIDPLFEAPEPARVRGASVTFEPGARTAWHTHPLGQTLIVTSGLGWAQREGGPIEEIRPGDVVWFAPGEKHWHGATPTTAMTHIAIQEALNGKPVDWMEKVSDEQYRRVEHIQG